MKLTRAELTIDLAAVEENWLWMRSQLAANCDCGAVVKADAYGLGVAKVVPRLFRAGCRSFYVSTLEEGLGLQTLLGGNAQHARVFVLTGCAHGDESAFLESGLIPVIISLEMFHRWQSAYAQYSRSGVAVEHVEAAIKVDSGMGRLGLGEEEFERGLLEERFARAGIRYLFSHLACADLPEHPLNAKQLARFNKIIQLTESAMPGLKMSFANSAGTLLGQAYHFDYVRPGIALYGGQPMGGQHFPLKTVLSLVLPVIQVKKLSAGESVGYGATRCWETDRVIVLAQSGYADGLLRSLSNTGSGMLLLAEKNMWVNVPMVGRISMDTILFDVTDVGAPVQVGDAIEVLGPRKNLEVLAAQAGSINHEVLTSLSGRYSRKYLGEEALE